MAIQQIIQGDVPELRQRSQPVTTFDATLTTLIDHLIDTLKENRGLGLSAPQIGVYKRIFVMDVGAGIEVFVNPEIMETTDVVNGYEGCLSFPDHSLKISRPRQITLKAQDQFGHPVKLVAKELAARVICHEVDHFDGILFTDRLTDTELFSQLIGSAIPSDHGTGGDVDIITGSIAELKASREELQLSVDMLGEFAWRLVLCMEILNDYSFEDTIDWKGLKGVSKLLDDTIDIIEQRMESLDTVIRDEESHTS